MFESESPGAARTRIFLARHAETGWNVEGRFQGHLDSELTERGLEQARLLGQRLAHEPLSAVYSSDLGRALETALQVAGQHDLAVQGHRGLREIDTGDWTGLHRTEVRAVPEWSEGLSRYRQSPLQHRMPGGESISDVQARALAALGEIAARHPGQAVAVLSHHVTVETLIARALQLELTELWLPFRGGNCYLSVLEIEGESIRAATIYDGTHLELNGTGPDGSPGAPDVALA